MQIKITFLCVIVLCSILSVFAQQSIIGKVVEVVDGKNLIIEVPDKTKFAVQLQYIEVPTSEHSFSQVVKSHLQKLTLGKEVSFQLSAVINGKNVGKILIDDIDISQQLMRDGAAWHSLPESAQQPYAERNEYQVIETAAKTEKRGLWNVPNLKPSWVVLAEQEAKRKADEKLALEAEEIAIANRKAKKLEEQIKAHQNSPWKVTRNFEAIQAKPKNDDPFLPDTNELASRYDRFTGKTMVLSRFVSLRMKSSSHELEQILLRVVHRFDGTKAVPGKGIYLISFIALGNDAYLNKYNDLVFLTDSSRITFGRGSRDLEIKTMLGIRVYEESLLFPVDRNTLLKIANSSQADLKLGSYEGSMSGTDLDVIREFLQTQ